MYGLPLMYPAQEAYGALRGERTWGDAGMATAETAGVLGLTHLIERGVGKKAAQWAGKQGLKGLAGRALGVSVGGPLGLALGIGLPIAWSYKDEIGELFSDYALSSSPEREQKKRMRLASERKNSEPGIFSRSRTLNEDLYLDDPETIEQLYAALDRGEDIRAYL
jgi:hypothetical protein